MPTEFPPSSQIHIIKDKPEAENKDNIAVKTRIINKLTGGPANEKSYSVENIRTKYKDAYRPWTVVLDDELTIMYYEEVNIKDMAKHFGRTRGTILSRIKKLELEELYG